MGTSLCISLENVLGIIDLLLSLTGIIVAVCIVRGIQNKLTNTRVLKDYYIEELKDIRSRYRAFVDEILKDSIEPKRVAPFCKLLSIRTFALMRSANSRFKLNEGTFLNYHFELLSYLTNCDSFIRSYLTDEKVSLSQSEKNGLIKIQSKYAHLFNDMILSVNEQN